MAKSTAHALCTICDPPRAHAKGTKHVFRATVSRDAVVSAVGEGNDATPSNAQIGTMKHAPDTQPASIVPPTVLSQIVSHETADPLERYRQKTRDRVKRFRERQRAKETLQQSAAG